MPLVVSARPAPVAAATATSATELAATELAAAKPTAADVASPSASAPPVAVAVAASALHLVKAVVIGLLLRRCGGHDGRLRLIISP